MGLKTAKADPEGLASRGVRLLSIAPDLEMGVPVSELDEARERAALPVVSFASGPWRPESLANGPGVRGEVHGFIVLEGQLSTDLTFAGRVCMRMLAPDEFVLLDGWQHTSLPLDRGWTNLTCTTLAVFDERLIAMARRWPHLMINILKRGAQQHGHALLQQAVNQLPRVEDRLLALMWSIAERQGTVGNDGIHIKLDVTHETMARMIGARRPTVSLGLSALKADGLLATTPDGWIISPDSLATLDRATTPAAPLLAH